MLVHVGSQYVLVFCHEPAPQESISALREKLVRMRCCSCTILDSSKNSHCLRTLATIHATVTIASGEDPSLLVLANRSSSAVNFVGHGLS